MLGPVPMTADPHLALDDEWFTAALGEPVHVRARTAVGAGVGLLGSLVRVELADGRRLVVKAPSTDPQVRAIAGHFGYYAREAGAYRVLLAGAGLPTPNCHAVVDSPRGPVLVLDDLATHHPADQLAGATTAQAHAAAALLADVHARFWDDPRLAVCPWLPGPTDPVIEVYGHLFERTWDAFVGLVDGLVPAAHLAAAESVIGRFGTVLSAFSHAPRTLVHGDYRLDNLLFTADGTAAVLDWQLAAWGRGAYDLAFFASGSIDPELLAGLEDDLLAGYHGRLVARGVTGYALEACRYDYLGGLVMNLPNPVTALVAVPPGNERGARLLRENARRALATVARHAASLSSW